MSILYTRHSPLATRYFAFIVVPFLALVLAACSKKNDNSKQVPEVLVAAPIKQMVTKYEEYTGTVAATQQVNLVARVEGFLESINFNDGQFVKKGDLLFIIQQDSYIEKVKRSQATLDYDNSEYQRQLSMLKENATSQADVEKYLSKVQVDKADLELAKINLSYTEVRAPFDGLLAAHQADVGAVVGSSPMSPTVLVVIEAITPVYVNFNINTRDALTLRDELNKMGEGPERVVGNLPVFVALSNEEGFPHEGILDFVNNSVDTSTGTIQVRAIFPNQDHALIPGFFAKVRIAIGAPFEAITVPNSIIQSDQVGEFILTVNSKNMVQRNDIKTGPRKGEARAILEGLSENESVIVAGINSARIGAPVNPKPASQKIPFSSTVKLQTKD
ncbi:MAG: efflux RND transporter periplasmic adaptor subunit [Chthoniobacterales bacterium]|nr:efflux RND transporter periplasmic adaptor subunit [Chthoniobacterales bacterium]